MRYIRFAASVLLFVLATVVQAQAQDSRPLLAVMPLRFESWQAALPSDAGSKPMPTLLAPAPDRKRHALLGGAIGAAAGVVVCTAISTLVDDSAEGGVSFCPLDTYLLFAGAGFVLGAVVGWMI
jgi:hypothetical protein